MAITEKQQISYGKVAKFLHWLLALNIGATLIFSYGMSDLTDVEKAVEYGNHAVSVTTIFILMVMRTIWRLLNPPPPIPMQESTQKKLANAAHLAFYVLIFLQITIGVFLASTTAVDFSTEEYGIHFSTWALISQEYHDLLLLAHKTGFYLIGGLVVVHILAALKHHFIDKDNVLRRMLPFVKTIHNNSSHN